MLHFKGITFKFIYKNGRVWSFTGSCGYCMDKYRAEKDDIAEVYQLADARYTKISD